MQPPASRETDAAPPVAPLEVGRAVATGEQSDRPDEPFATIFEHAEVGLAQTDAEGRYLRVNQAMCAIAGVSREDMLARGCFDDLHPEDRASALTLHRRQIAGDLDRYAIRARHIRTDGGVVWVSIRSTAVRDDA